jgi:hypothetical protein
VSEGGLSKRLDFREEKGKLRANQPLECQKQWISAESNESASTMSARHASMVLLSDRNCDCGQLRSSFVWGVIDKFSNCRLDNQTKLPKQVEKWDGRTRFWRAKERHEKKMLIFGVSKVENDDENAHRSTEAESVALHDRQVHWQTNRNKWKNQFGANLEVGSQDSRAFGHDEWFEPDFCLSAPNESGNIFIFEADKRLIRNAAVTCGA